MRVETQIRFQEAINSMHPMDREVLVLRHFEMLSNKETAEVRGISKRLPVIATFGRWAAQRDPVVPARN
jgi:hypothetical protein